MSKLQQTLILPTSLVIAAIVLDALTEYPPIVGGFTGPSSMRMTTLVLVVWIATLAPAGLLNAIQTYVLVAVLIVVSCTGLHESDYGTRIAAAFYTTVVSWVALLCGVFQKTEASDDERFAKSVVLVMAFMIHCGIRILGRSFTMCSDVQSRVVLAVDNGTMTSVNGCSVCNSFIMVSASCVGASATLAALVVLLRTVVNPHMSILTRSRHMETVMSVSAVLQTVGTMCAIFGTADTTETLQVLYGDNACRFGSACDGARALRRFNLITHPTSICVLSLLATLSLIAAVRNIITHTKLDAHATSSYGNALIVALFISAGVALELLVISHSDWSATSDWYTDAASITVIAGVAISGLFNGWETIGIHVIFVGLFIEFGSYFWIVGREWQAALRYFTIFSNTLMACLYVARTAAALVHFSITHEPLRWISIVNCLKDRLLPTYETCKTRIETFDAETAVPKLEVAIECLTICGYSISFLLMLASTALQALYDGGEIPRRDGLYPAQRATFAFIIWHYAPAIAWSLLSSYNRCRTLQNNARLAISITAGVISLAAYAIFISTGRQLPSDYPSDAVLIAIAAVGCIFAPWFAHIHICTNIEKV